MQLTRDQLSALDLNRHVIVVAGAGSGKTTVLVERYLGILLSEPEAAVSRVLAITFTEKAAGEMKQRVLSRLDQLYQNEPGLRPKILAILQAWPEARISTIHAFCQQLLNTHALEAGLAPQSAIADAQTLARILDQSFWEFFSTTPPLPAHSRELVTDVLRFYPVRQLKRLFLAAYANRLTIERFLHRYAEQTPEQIAADWQALRQAHYRSLLDALGDVTPLLDGLLRGLPSEQNKTLQTFSRACSTARAELASADLETQVRGVGTLLQALFTEKGTPRKGLQKQIAKLPDPVPQLFQQLLAQTEPLARLWVPTPENNPELEARQARLLKGICVLFRALFEQVERRKARLQLMDFDDLLLRTRRMLEANPGLARQLGERYRWILVDEFQDTDPVQAEIIARIAGLEPGKAPRSNLFLVGDPKQAIYGFRNADVHIFQDYLERLPGLNRPEVPLRLPPWIRRSEGPSPAAGSGRVLLRHNFRSTGALIAFFNALFEPILNAGGPHEVAFQPLADGAGRPGVEPAAYYHIECPNELNGEQVTALVAHQVIEIIQRLTDPKAQASHAYGHIAILLQDRRPLPALEAALSRAGIPFQVYKGIGFFQTREVQDVFYLLNVVARPEDDFALVTALRSPYLGVSDATLFFLSRCRGNGYLEKIRHLLDFQAGRLSTETCFQADFAAHLKDSHGLPIEAEELSVLRWLLAQLPGWQVLAGHGQISQLLHRLIRDFNLHLLHQTTPEGRQVLANLEKLEAFAYHFERNRSARLLDFLHVLEAAIQGELKEGQAPLFDPEANQVKVMTIHAAKGLEFPVVILPFLEAGFRFKADLFRDKRHGFLPNMGSSSELSSSFISQWYEKNQRSQIVAEKKRLLYVAATRARDRLVLVGASGQSRQASQSFLHLIHPVLESLAQPGPSGPPSVRVIPVNGEEIQLPEPPARAESEPTPASAPETEALEAALKWIDPLPSQPEGNAYSATQLMLFTEDPERFRTYYLLREGRFIPPQMEEAFEDEPGGVPWGILVHRALEHVHLRPPEADRAAIDRLVGQLGLSRETGAAFRERLQQLLADFRRCETGRYLTSGIEQYAELRLLLPLQAGVLQGVLDRLYRDAEGHWTVL
ncbi:MAG: hypothetical protein D6715_14840, partial [Calditrichaeota bacterium]